MRFRHHIVRKKQLALSTVIIYLIGIHWVFARQDVVPGSRYTSGRAAAMGDAFIPLADDGAAGLFYNPAGLGKVKYFQLEPMNFQLQANSDFLSSVDRNFYKATSLGKYYPKIITKSPAFPGMSATIFPNFAARGFAFGVLMMDQISATSPDGVNIRNRSKYLFIPTFGAGLRLAGGVIRLGYSLQWVNQASGDITLPASESLGYNEGLAQGSAMSHTLGLALTLPVSYLPSLNFVARNLLNAKFGSFSILSLAKNVSGVPDTELTSYDASVSIQAKVGGGGSVNMVVEYRDLTNRSGISLFGRLCAGMEFSFRDQFFLRTGWGSGYPSAGLGLRRKKAEFSLSWFSQEAGTKYHELRDTRYILHYQIRAF